ncbi:monovalent cation/H(+) antiporter subunit G [Belnapia mucosa]|nr:monovalent cation/H(+) antiporter subunit G [Belnapia mucosa]
MRALAVDLLLGLGVLAAWLAAIGMLRLRTPLDRLHLVAFLATGPGLAFLLAALVEDGFGQRPLKLLLLVLALLAVGAGLAHAAGAALVRRIAAGERE